MGGDDYRGALRRNEAARRQAKEKEVSPTRSKNTPVAERFEEIGDWLDLEGDVTFTEDGKPSLPSLESIIVETVARLPEDVYERLLHGEGPYLWFVGCGPGQLGQAIRRHFFLPPGVESFEQDLILLSNELCSMPMEKACGTVAHEIAHVILGHTDKEHTEMGIGIDDNSYRANRDRSEGGADALAISWGFDLS
jgi:hypothetical protein